MRNNFIFILVRPVFSGNIGSVARVLKNFNFEQLRLIEPPKGYKDSECRRMTAGAFDLLKTAPVFTTLTEALQDISLAIGTTAGQFRDESPVPLKDIMPEILTSSRSNKIAWVFGDERNGLTKDDLKRCHKITTIPTNEDFPSLNLSQAVGTVAYEITRGDSPKTPALTQHPTGKDDDELFARIDDLLNRIEFTRSYNREVILKELRNLYQRTIPSMREFDLLNGIIRRMNHKLDEAD